MRDTYSEPKTDSSESLQAQLEETYAKNNAKEIITQHLISVGIADVIKSAELPYKAAMSVMVQISKLKRAKFPVLAGTAIRHFKDESHPGIAVSQLLTNMTNLELVYWSDRDREFVVVFDIPEHVQMRLDRLQYPLPMVVEPVKVRNNRMTGYETIRGSLMLKGAHKEDDICLDHINRVNAVPLRLNMNVVAFVQNQWKNLDKQKPDETLVEFRKRQRAFQKYNESAFDVINALTYTNDQFWLTHKYDKRGRTYAQGYHVNYQGNDWNKSCVELAEGELLNE